MKIVKVILTTLCLMVFGINAKSQSYKVLHSFGNGDDGKQPDYSSLISDGTYLYGMTQFGGTNDYGAIFKIKPDGTGYTKLLDFNGTNGRYPYGSLITIGAYLYGMTANGGANGSGVIFKIKPDGTGYTKLFDFNGTNGALPFGSLISDGTYLYGMTEAGSYPADGGRVFKINPDGTGFTTLYTWPAQNTNGMGANPYGSLISDGTYLYGMTRYGGTNAIGVIFKIKTDGTGYTKLLDFTGANGNGPHGSLISDGTYLYGMTYYGGANTYYGVVFKIKPDGTGYTKLYDFGNNGNGSLPYGSLINDGTYLFGMTSGDGGSYGNGVIFKMKPDGTNYAKLSDFPSLNGTLGRSPKSSLISDGTYLYGMTSEGGDNDNGVIFKFKQQCTYANLSIPQFTIVYRCQGENYTIGNHTYTEPGSYTDTLYTVNNCDSMVLKTTLIRVTGNCTGINEISHNNFQVKIYPNPVNEILTIELESANTNFEMKIFDVLGKEMMGEKLKTRNGKTEVDVSSLQNGIYFIKIGDRIGKLLKESP